MDLAPMRQSLLDDYLAAFDPQLGDKRTERTFRGTVRGIIGAESLVCSRIAASPPVLSTGGHIGEQRVRRMARGESTKRSEFDAERLTGKLQERGIEQLWDKEEVWAIVDPSELRKPYTKEMPALMRVRTLGWVVAGFLYELSVTLEWPEIQLLGRLGGWPPRPDRPRQDAPYPRSPAPARTEAILSNEVRRNGPLPPRIAAFLGPD